VVDLVLIEDGDFGGTEGALHGPEYLFGRRAGLCCRRCHCLFSCPVSRRLGLLPHLLFPLFLLHLSLALGFASRSQDLVLAHAHVAYKHCPVLIVVDVVPCCVCRSVRCHKNDDNEYCWQSKHSCPKQAGQVRTASLLLGVNCVMPFFVLCPRSCSRTHFSSSSSASSLNSSWSLDSTGTFFFCFFAGFPPNYSFRQAPSTFK